MERACVGLGQGLEIDRAAQRRAACDIRQEGIGARPSVHGIRQARQIGTVPDSEGVVAFEQVHGARAGQRTGYGHCVAPARAGEAAVHVQRRAVADRGVLHRYRGAWPDIQRAAEHVDLQQVGRGGTVDVEGADAGFGHAFEVDQCAQIGGQVDVVDAGVQTGPPVDGADDIGAVAHDEGIVAIPQREGSPLRVERADHIEYIVAGAQVAAGEQGPARSHGDGISAHTTDDRRGRTARSLQRTIDIERRVVGQRHGRRAQCTVHVQRAAVDRGAAAEALCPGQRRRASVVLLKEFEIDRIAGVEAQCVGVVQHDGVACAMRAAVDDVAQHRAVVECQRVVTGGQVDGATAADRAGHVEAVVARAARVAAVDIQGRTACHRRGDHAVYRTGSTDIQRAAQDVDRSERRRSRAIDVERADVGLGQRLEVDYAPQDHTAGDVSQHCIRSISATQRVDQTRQIRAVV
ncbi:hypothetical protein PseAD21_16575 [Pseudomonas sp. AD21]|nr:hypothetical protein PseAD21_16575 [Pseudomonas sp. AD21]